MARALPKNNWIQDRDVAGVGKSSCRKLLWSYLMFGLDDGGLAGGLATTWNSYAQAVRLTVVPR